VLAGKIVVITGAGSGLGRELAKAFCAEECKVVGIGRTLENLEETGEICGEAFEARAADVANAGQIKTVFDEIASRFGAIDILFNNAAVYPKHSFLEESAESFAKAIAINVNGVANTCKAVLPFMLKQKSGKIFNVGSWADLGPIADSAVYSTSKGALHALTKAIAADVAQAGYDEIEIHEWIPGHLNTQMSEYTGMDPATAAAWGLEIAARRASRQNVIYEQNWEWQPPKSLKQRIKSKALFWR